MLEPYQTIGPSQHNRVIVLARLHTDFPLPGCNACWLDVLCSGWFGGGGSGQNGGGAGGSGYIGGSTQAGPLVTKYGDRYSVKSAGTKPGPCEIQWGSRAGCEGQVFFKFKQFH